MYTVCGCLAHVEVNTDEPGLVVGYTQSGDMIMDLLLTMLSLVYSLATHMAVLGVYCGSLLGALACDLVVVSTPWCYFDVVGFLGPLVLVG